MSLNAEEIQKIAYLARLAISGSEAESYAANLSGILGLVEQMNSVDTSAVEPMSHPQDLGQRLRADVVTEADQREKLMSNAPAQEAGLFLVPQVIE